MFKKLLESMFTVTDIKKMVIVGCISCVMIKNINACNGNMTQTDLQIEMRKLLVQGKKMYYFLKHHLKHFLVNT